MLLFEGFWTCLVMIKMPPKTIKSTILTVSGNFYKVFKYYERFERQNSSKSGERNLVTLVRSCVFVPRTSCVEFPSTRKNILFFKENLSLVRKDCLNMNTHRNLSSVVMTLPATNGHNFSKLLSKIAKNHVGTKLTRPLFQFKFAQS